MRANKKLYIKVCKELVEVSQEVYLEYYRSKRREKAQKEKEQYNRVVSFDALDTESRQGSQLITNTASPEPEDLVIAHELHEKLYASLSKLSEQERQILKAIYFDRLSEREAAAKLGMPYMTLHNRKKSILTKMLKMMNS